MNIELDPSYLHNLTIHSTSRIYYREYTTRNGKQPQVKGRETEIDSLHHFVINDESYVLI